MLAIVSAPSNLGLRPPEPGAVPGTAKAPEALREAGLYSRLAELGARDAGTVLPARYVDDDATRPAGHFQHPAISDECASVAGEDLAAAIGLHWPAIADIDGRGPYFDPERTVHIGCRDDDSELDLVRATIGAVAPASEVILHGGARAAARVRDVADQGAGYWLQVDVDVLDPEVMPAVDSPDPGGLRPDELTALLQGLAPRAIGASITVFDPDLDPDGLYAVLLTDIIVSGLAELGTEL
ncbi:arginase family protein [Microbacterium sp.]|uniref:arginase family protein n=1 Tax=Microbacterium sp. TaxID=51671 RepID=UPI002D76ACA0|nr:arginase family protein [Microbacterium sp.]HET6302048.1 arginase family protein [Microbacterium sp.]